MSPLVQDATGNNLTYRIIGAAMTVHNSLGPGFREEVYEKALFTALQDAGMETHRQYPVNVDFAGATVGLFYLDLFVENLVVVEVKALSHLLTNDEIAQVIGYLKAVHSSVGLLVNFGRRKLNYKRIFPPRNQEPIHRIGRDDIIRHG